MSTNHPQLSWRAGPGSRREFLRRSFCGGGALALANLLGSELGAAAMDPMAPKPPHLPRKAKNCIFLFMAGGVSQLDSFDPKPALERFAGKRLPAPPGVGGEVAGFLKSAHVTIPSRFSFKRYGHSGHSVSELFPHIARQADDLAMIFGIRAENNNHAPATLAVNTGSILQGNPSIGSWVTYGLGSPGANLPGYVVLQDQRGPTVNGSTIWSSGFLSPSYQGTPFRMQGAPILDLRRPAEISEDQQRKELDYLASVNRRHLASHPGEADLEARIGAYELAFRMQMEAPAVVDLNSESEAVRASYGIGGTDTDAFGRQCLMARRLVEKGVRFVTLTHGVDIGRHSWDDHTDIGGLFPLHAREVDQPVGALLADLKARGLLDETLVVWATEMGRTPISNSVGSARPGREHNQYATCMWMAGGNVKGGATAGATDELGIGPLESPIHMRDVHATILDLMGLDQQRLNFFHEGRFKKLTDIGGHVLGGIIA